jgi:hypothetical protein
MLKKKKNLKKKSKIDISKEVRDIFFNAEVVEDDDNVIENKETSDVCEDLEVLEDVEVLDTEKEVEAPETVPIPDGSINDVEHFTVVASFSDDGEEIKTVQCIRKNQPPPENTWADKDIKFTGGQRIMPKTLKKKDIPNYECAVVISPGTYPNTYIIKVSRSLNETTVIGANWVVASEKCKPYISFWEANSPPKKVL